MKIVDKQPRRDRRLAGDEAGGSTVETALIFSLAATLAIVMRSSVAMPLLDRFVEAARVIERALS